MKKDILILAALIAVVIAVPFLATKAEEAIQIKNEEFKEKQNRECYEKAEECMDAGKYDEAIELLTGFPAGEMSEDGQMQAETINARVAAQLAQLSSARQAFSGEHHLPAGGTVSPRDHG